MKTLVVLFALALSNFGYQLVAQDPNWLSAFERTWFQGTALLVYYLLDRYVWRD